MLRQVQRALSAAARKVVVMPGDGIGPEITEATLRVIDALKLPLRWEFHKIHSKSVTEQGDLISQETIAAIEQCGLGLKGPFETPIGKGHRSLNVTLRKRLRLFANLRPCRSLAGVRNQLFPDVNVVTVRENTEGEYSGLEHCPVPGVAENLKIITRRASDAIARFACEFAARSGRRKLTCAHKSGVMRLTDGCFVEAVRAAAEKHPQLQLELCQIDTLCGRLVRAPRTLDVMVMPNLYGDIVSDLAAGLIGGLGLTPSGNIGEKSAVYEAVHGTAPDIAGKGLANPTALLLSAAMMLEHAGFAAEAARVEGSVARVLGEGKWVTRDLGGQASTAEYTTALIDSL